MSRIRVFEGAVAGLLPRSKESLETRPATAPGVFSGSKESLEDRPVVMAGGSLS
jgi:hypothetical protein